MAIEDLDLKYQLTFPANSKEAKTLSKIVSEYNKLLEDFEEPKDAQKLRLKAYELAEYNSQDITTALKTMRLAIKIMKSCNGLR
ncbi:MAG: hypothetical protein KGD59_04155 [Candidatus Heimdallarchaeota archaeon]|nr:hypothetical protein [Candidatus Heimdallarchaeota archaeon]MBY8993719.1 hypothetical protein [Candidatus Heimdallarchaeota archaeon]